MAESAPIDEPRECMRCGEALPSFGPHLRTVLRMQKTPVAERAQVMALLESVSGDVASAWLHHRMHETCERRPVHCSCCGGELRTRIARWCPHCKFDWH